MNFLTENRLNVLMILTAASALMAARDTFAAVNRDYYSYQTMDDRLAEKARTQKAKYSTAHCEYALSLTGTAEIAQALAKTADEIFSRNPPEKYIILGIGGSPSPIIAHLQFKAANYAFNVPLSLPVIHGTSRRIIPPNSRRALDGHFSRFLPDRDSVGDREIVMIDFSATGNTLHEAVNAVNLFLEEQNRITRSVPLYLVAMGTSIPFACTDEILHLDPVLSSVLRREALKPLAEYPSFIPGYTDSEGLQQNPLYRIYLESLQNRELPTQ